MCVCVHEHGHGFILGELPREELRDRVENEGRSGEINFKDSREEQEWPTQGTFSKEISKQTPTDDGTAAESSAT